MPLPLEGVADGPTSASHRSLSDAGAPLGYATTRTLERVLSSCGLLNGAPLRFEAADDVAKGGVLFALPALLGEGLLRHTRQHYTLPPGYYPLETLFLLLGLLALVREKIVPRLLAEAPQPTEAALQTDPQAVRFTLVVDREGYSPVLFAELAEQRIAILTYHKKPGEPWPAGEFVGRPVRLHTGQEVVLDLAERSAGLSNGLALREVRVRDADGSQSSILTTHPTLDLTRVAAAIKARWSQENYLKYMKIHFGLDRLIEYGVTPLPETTVVINPAYRRLDQEVRRERATLTRCRAQFGAHGLPQNPTPEQAQTFEIGGGELREKIVAQEAVLAARIGQRKATPRKLTLKELPEAERFGQLCPESKHFIDTIKMIAYRAESALAGEVREVLAREDDARVLLRRIFTTPVNLRPDPGAKTLTVEVHRLGSALQDAAVAHLCTVLTQTETCFPSTDLRLIYRQVGSN